MRVKIPRIFQGLLSKLLLGYLLITILSWLASSLVMGLYQYHRLRGQFEPEVVSARIAARAGELVPFIESSPPNSAALKLWLDEFRHGTESERARLAPDIYRNLEALGPPRDFLLVAGRDGSTLATVSAGAETAPEFSAPEFSASEFSAPAQLSPEEANLVRAALGGESDPDALSFRVDGGGAVAAAPIKTSSGEVIGAAFTRAKVPVSWQGAFRKLALNWVAMFPTMTVMFIYTGLVFSFLLGRSIIERLKRISATANAWSAGDFKARADDGSADEVGLLARRLNSMAQDLSDYFALKQELAAVEERNKLARDLHDSVKQQVFAMAMQIGAANLLAKESADAGVEKALTHLAEAEKLGHSVQQELVNLINELRPASKKSESVAERLRAYAADWSRQNDVAVEFVADLPAAPLAPAVEHGLFRIAQEALANVARHSGAAHVVIELKSGPPGVVRLSIADDGSGFAPSTVNGGFGLGNMRERAEALPGGRLEIESDAGDGTRIAVACKFRRETE